jgi:peptidoglycan/xylan/chitin deacetylase (PgdA/CDA1 family)
MKKIVILMLLFVTVTSFAQIKTFYTNAGKNVKKVSLTFDDGPGKSTRKILKILEEKKVKATFFMLGRRVRNDPETAKAVFVAGHEIANHTYEHINFYVYKCENKMSKMKNELLQCEKIINDILHIKPFLARFPYGYARADAIEVTRNNGYYLINWHFGIDWKNIPTEKMHEKYKNAIGNGAIFLMHDLPKNDKVISFLADFIDEIKEAGYEIVPVGELLNLKRF